MKPKFLFFVSIILAGMFFYGCDPVEDPGNNDGKVTDVDGNEYKTVTINGKVWMAENLKVTKYNDGTAITNITEQSVWKTQTAGAYCWQDNEATNKDKYGALYNYYAVTSGKLAPSGWHVATYDEWTDMTNYLFQNLGNSGSIAKAMADTTGWELLNAPGNPGYMMATNNSSGFKAVPAGGRKDTGFLQKGYVTNWWAAPGTSSEYYFGLAYQNSGVTISISPKYYGYSVRCVKD